MSSLILWTMMANIYATTPLSTADCEGHEGVLKILGEQLVVNPTNSSDKVDRNSFDKYVH